MILNMHEYKEASGIVVIIDVLRAFSTSAEIFMRGASKIYITSNIDKALNTKRIHKDKNVVLVGEKGGRFIKGFDYDNSPFKIRTLKKDFRNNIIVLRTSSGVKGIEKVFKSSSVDSIFCVGGSTLHTLKNFLESFRGDYNIDYLITGSKNKDQGDEDRAAAEYLMGSLSIEEFNDRVGNSFSAQNWIKEYMDIICSIDNQYDFIQQVFMDENNNLFIGGVDYHECTG